MNRRRAFKSGQSVLEYTLIVAAVVAALLAMNVYVQRSIMANLKTIEHQMNNQPN